MPRRSVDFGGILFFIALPAEFRVISKCFSHVLRRRILSRQPFPRWSMLRSVGPQFARVDNVNRVAGIPPRDSNEKRIPLPLSSFVIKNMYQYVLVDQAGFG